MIKVSQTSIDLSYIKRLSECLAMQAQRFGRLLSLGGLLLIMQPEMATAQDTVENYIHEYPNQEQVKMMDAWLADHKPGSFQFTAYGADNKLLIPNANKRYDRTTYASKPNADSTYTVTLSPEGQGRNVYPPANRFTQFFAPISQFQKRT